MRLRTPHATPAIGSLCQPAPGQRYRSAPAHVRRSSVKQDLREATRFLARNPGFAGRYRAHARPRDRRQLDDLQRPQRRPAAPARLRPARRRWSVVWESNVAHGQERAQVAAATYLDWRERSRLFRVDRHLPLSRLHADRRRTKPERLITVDASPKLFSAAWRAHGARPDLHRRGRATRRSVAQGRAQLRARGCSASAAIQTSIGRTMMLDDAAARDRRRHAGDVPAAGQRSRCGRSGRR